MTKLGEANFEMTTSPSGVSGSRRIAFPLKCMSPRIARGRMAEFVGAEETTWYMLNKDFRRFSRDQMKEWSLAYRELPSSGPGSKS